MSVVKLLSKDGEIVEVEEDIARHCALLDDMLNFLERDGNPFLVRKLDSYTLKKIFAWIRHHKEDPAPENYTEISEWDEEFLRVEKKVLFNIMTAADFLNIAKLMETLGKHFADMIKGKSVEEIREMFHFENDFTPEEEEEVISENSYGPDKVEDEVEDEEDEEDDEDEVEEDEEDETEDDETEDEVEEDETEDEVEEDEEDETEDEADETAEINERILESHLGFMYWNNSGIRGMWEGF